MIKYFDFEKSIETLDLKINELENQKNELNKYKIEEYNLEKTKLYKKIYSKLNAWQKVQIARHPDRPHSTNYINSIFKNQENYSNELESKLHGVYRLKNEDK